MPLFDDQADLYEDARNAIRQGHKRILVRAETGSGKTWISTHLIHNANARGNVCAFVVPRKELLHQTAFTFQAFGITNYSYIAAGKYYSPNSQNYLCTMQTLCNRLDHMQPNIVIIDEAHFGAAQMDKIIQHYSDAGAYVIGLSATPEKTNGKPMGDWYDVMVEGKDLRWLIDNQRLSDYRLFVPHTISVDSLRIVNGDYSKSQADALIDADRAVVGSVVEFYKKYAMGKRHMTFAQNIKKSKEMAEAYNAAGVPSAHMDGDTPDGERKRIINAYADGEYLNICSVDLLFFGFDLSAQVGREVPVESMSDVRLTGSRIVQRQKTGRVLRYKPCPALIFDHVGNALPERHGLPCAPQEWSLHGKVKRKKSKGESDGMRQCMKCFYVHYTAPICPNCGNVYLKKPPAEYEQIDGELVEIQKQQERKAKRIEESMCQTLDDWMQLAEERGYKKAWAYKRYELRKGKA